jgi:hypothetical protein
MHYIYGEFPRAFPVLSLHLSTETDRSGKFVFEKVPAGERRIYHVLGHRNNKPGPLPATHSTYLAVKPGAATRLDLGSGGKNVAGQLTLANWEKPFDWTRDFPTLQPKPPIPDRPMEADFPDRERWVVAMQAWGREQRAFYESDAGREFQRNQSGYAAAMDDRGRFVFRDVLPGYYTLTIHLTSEPGQGLGPSAGMPFRGTPIATEQREVYVPETEEPTVVDLGTISVKARTNASPTAAARLQ